MNFLLCLFSGNDFSSLGLQLTWPVQTTCVGRGWSSNPPDVPTVVFSCPAGGQRLSALDSLHIHNNKVAKFTEGVFRKILILSDEKLTSRGSKMTPRGAPNPQNESKMTEIWKILTLNENINMKIKIHIPRKNPYVNFPALVRLWDFRGPRGYT